MIGTQKKNQKGFTLVESLIAIAIFALLAGVIYQTSALLIRTVGVYRDNVAISSLASQYMEIVHNLPYSSVGTLNGNPPGNLPDLPNAPETTVNNTLYKIYYVVNYIDDPADGTVLEGTDFASNDYKQVKLYVQNVSTGKSHSFLTNITPKGLESLSNGGALFVKVFDSVGQPVPNATINITNSILSPNINLTRTTDATGNWIEVGLPESANSYHIVATKDGYSSDQTYPISVGNPNPTKPDSTITNGQITQISFSIDKLSTLSFKTIEQSCSAINGVGLAVQGAKLIGNPNLLKFDHTYTSNSQGDISLGSIEWDNYTPALTGSTYMVYGSSPIQQVSVLPDTDQNFTLLLGPKSANALLVIVKDSATDNPIEGATVSLTNNNPSVDENGVTGGSVWSTNNWSDISGLDSFNVSTDLMPTALRLLSYDNGVSYVPDGNLTSAVFDTNATTTAYTTLTWQPTSQDPATELKFQIATSDDNLATTTWNFLGPDGTNATYYETPGTTINNQPARYVRYKVFLNSSDTTKSPVLTSVNINYVSGCPTPGQVFFPNLTVDNGYKATVSADGYQTQTISDLNISGYQVLNVSLNN